MSKLDEVKAVLIAATQGLTDEEKSWAIKQAFPNEIGAIVVDKVAEQLSRRDEMHVKNFESGKSDTMSVDNTKARYNIKYDDNIIEIGTAHSIDVDIESSTECGYVGAGGMHFTYDNPEETTIRLTF